MPNLLVFSTVIANTLAAVAAVATLATAVSRGRRTRGRIQRREKI